MSSPRGFTVSPEYQSMVASEQGSYLVPPQPSYPPQVQAAATPYAELAPPQSAYPPTQMSSQQQNYYPIPQQQPQQFQQPPPQAQQFYQQAPIQTTQMYPPTSGYPPNSGASYQPQPQQTYGQAYAPTYAQNPQPVVASVGNMQGPKLTKFFVNMRKQLPRDYILVMDQSASMSIDGKWHSATQACMKIAPSACMADPDGVTLYLFHSHFKKFSNLRTANDVQAVFALEKPKGSTDLASVLQACFAEHFAGNKPTTILVITDGSPNDQNAVKKAIVGATRMLRGPEDLSVSFIQIGDDGDATTFLRDLDDNLRPAGAVADIVDTVAATDLGGLLFDQLIDKSLHD